LQVFPPVNDKTLSYIKQVLDFELDREQIGRAVNILRKINPKGLLEVVDTVAFRSLNANECLGLAEELFWCIPGLQLIVQLLSRHLKDDSLPKKIHDKIKERLILCLIGLAEFREAIGLFGSSVLSIDEPDIAKAFNYGMAEWGLNKIPPKNTFERVVQLAHLAPEILKESANYCQCLTIAYWIVGDNEKAHQYLIKAINLISKNPNAALSCWRYYNVAPSEFKEDCDSIGKLIGGEKIFPLFFNPS
jgi:tetratricopeptide (TPR) repeat protein